MLNRQICGILRGIVRGSPADVQQTCSGCRQDRLRQVRRLINQTVHAEGGGLGRAGRAAGNHSGELCEPLH